MKATKEQGKCKADIELIDLAPASLVKLNSEKVNGDLTELSKKEICAISFCYFGFMYKEANPKPVLVAGLKGLIAAQLTVILAAAAAAATAAAAAVASRLPPRPPRLRRLRRPREARFRKKTMSSSSQGLGDIKAHSP
jgi:hypothetical protein